MKSHAARAVATLFLWPLLAAVGCKSPHVEVTVENHSGAAIRLLEVDYPSASFGADSIDNNGALHYRVQVSGEGPLKVQYTAAGGRQCASAGPELREGQKGRVEIDLRPQEKIEFHASLAPGR